MKINTKLRIKALKRKLKRLTAEYNRRSLTPYGYSDPYETYVEIEYWEEELKWLKL